MNRRLRGSGLMRAWVGTPFDHFPLFWGFVRQEIKGRFAGSVFGMVWIVFVPLCNILMYIFVFSMILKVRLPAGGHGTTSFTVYLLTGLLPWMVFSECLLRSTDILLANSSIISKVAFPVQVLPYSLVSVAFLFNGAGLVLLLCYLALAGYLHPSWLVLPVPLAGLFLFTVGLAAVVSGLTVFLRDLREIVAVGVQLWFYATPVLYPLSLVPEKIRWLMELNPVLPFISACRQSLLQGEYWSSQFTASLLLGLAMYLLGGYCFMRLRPAFGDVL